MIRTDLGRTGWLLRQWSLAALSSLVVGCDDSESPSAPTTGTVAYILLGSRDLALFAGDQLSILAFPKTKDGRSVTGVIIQWASSDTTVLTVDNSGLTQAKANGSASITASVDTIRASISVQVNPVSNAPNLRISDNTFFVHQEEPSIAIDPFGKLYVGWKEMDFPAGVNRVAFSASADNGETWTRPTLMALGSGNGASDPSLATDASGAVVFARVHTTNALPWIDPWRIVISRSTNGGLSWSDAVVVNQGTTGADKPSLHRASDGNLFLAYVSYTTTVNNIAVSRSLDNGANWEAQQTVPGAASLSHGPVVVGANGSANLAWWSRPDENIVFAGVSYGSFPSVPLTRLNTTSGTVRFFLNQGLVLQPAFPSMVRLPGGRLIVGWPDYAGGDWNVLVAHSDDGGKVWSTPVTVNDSRLDKQWMIALTAGGDGSIHAAWYDARSLGHTHVLYARSNDGGATWSRNLRITSAPVATAQPRLGDYLSVAADASGNAYLVWTDWRGTDMDVYFAPVVK